MLQEKKNVDNFMWTSGGKNVDKLLKSASNLISNNSFKKLYLIIIQRIIGKERFKFFLFSLKKYAFLKTIIYINTGMLITC